MPGRNPEARLILATYNQGKLQELRELLRDEVPGLDVNREVVGAQSAEIPEVPETGVTFRQNALLKAYAAAEATGLPAIADDSGLSVDVLGGAPGIFSARWAGGHGDDTANMTLLLAQLSDISTEYRGAEFRCAAALVTPDRISPDQQLREYVELGKLRGTLLTEPRGEGGFGYDPILMPTGMDRSCAELSAAEKNAISHRGQALRRLLPAVVSVLTS